MQNRSTSKKQEVDVIETGDVIRICLDPTLGGEMKKTRPCLVLQSGGMHFDLIIILPITDAEKKATSSLHVSIHNLALAGLSKSSAIDCFQIRAVSKTRFAKTLGKVESEVLDEVRTRVATILDIGEEHIISG